MRKIKFRAWDNHTKSWFQDGAGFGLSWDSTELIDDNDKTIYTKDRIEIEQFTGTFDRDGIEIYEGDIVKTGFATYEVSYIGCAFRMKTGKTGYILEGKKRYPTLKIIGNIHQNPELL